MRISPKQKAINIAVAKDVLNMMKILEIEQGMYISIVDSRQADHVNSLAYPGDGKLLQKNIRGIAQHCSVCAKGAMVLAHVHLYDGIAGLPCNNEMNSYAQKVFGAEHSDLIEQAFEVQYDEAPVKGSDQTYWEEYMAKNSIIRMAKLFGLQFADPKKRLRAIMKNIIVNNGVFTPKDIKNKGPQ